MYSDKYGVDLDAPESAGGEDLVSCGLCLGLLERLGSTLEAIRASLSETRFLGSTYQLNVAPPVAVSFRHAILMQHLRSDDATRDACPRVVSVKDVLRWSATSVLDSLAKFKDESETPVSVTVTCHYEGAVTSEMECLRKHAPDDRRKRRKVQEQGVQPISGATIQEVIDRSSADACLRIIGGASLAEHLGAVTGQSKVSVALGRSAIYLLGRYQKLRRGIPQAKWVVDDERRGDTSVEELVTEPIARQFGASSCGMHAEGREDIDVRMLGQGRTFVVEVRDAERTTLSCAGVESAVNVACGDAVKISGLERCDASRMSSLQAHAEAHRKTYACVCWSHRALAEADLVALSNMTDIEVAQQTPLRVLHRRTQATRPRTVHWMKATRINDHYFTLRVSTQAGTYVKEFVHGDMGRSRPSLKSILNSPVDILQLDVEGLEDD